MKNTLIIISITFIIATGCTSTPVTSTGTTQTIKPVVNINRTRAKAKEALAFCKQKKMDTGICILADMSLHSGVKRLFVWNFTTDTLTGSYLVGHGCCDNTWSRDNSKDAPVFSNVDGSHCSSLGKYKLGERAWSDWGINVKYVMHGLEPTNSNAFNRLIVFHAWDIVSDEEVYPNGTPEGWGCPTVSNNTLRVIDKQLKAANKPVLMWIYR